MMRWKKDDLNAATSKGNAGNRQPEWRCDNTLPHAHTPDMPNKPGIGLKGSDKRTGQDMGQDQG